MPINTLMNILQTLAAAKANNSTASLLKARKLAIQQKRQIKQKCKIDARG